MYSSDVFEFLMHRVELKGISCVSLISSSFFLYVPNAPCGVESNNPFNCIIGFASVPNAPCGVERY